jgi:hypothetical protein
MPNWLYTVPKDSENFVSDSYGAGRLISVTKVFFIDSGQYAALVFDMKLINLLGQCIGRLSAYVARTFLHSSQQEWVFWSNAH